MNFGALGKLICDVRQGNVHCTYAGKSLSEALIFASTNPQYDDRLLIELQVQYMKIASSDHVVYMNCSCNSMSNLSSYPRLVNAKIRTSDKDLPVPR